MRLEGRSALVVGGGQADGETIGNGRATAITFAREGARVLVADRKLDSAVETVDMIVEAGGEASAIEADVTQSDDCRAMVDDCVSRYDRVDILHNNVGIGAGDSGPVHLDERIWDRIQDVNLKGMYLTAKHALPVMREQQSGAIINISSIAAVCSSELLAYKTSKAGVNALTQALANGNARHGIRVNAIMPGLMDTPMAVDAALPVAGLTRDELVEARNRAVPLRHRMGTAWDVANAALFLASDEASFITGVILPVDGGQSARSG